MIKRLHIFLGLLTFTHFIVYGIAGLTASARPGLERPKQARSTRYVVFSAPENQTDKQVADLIYNQLKLPFTRPMPDWYLRRTPENDLLLDFWNINGIFRVTVLEKEQRLRIDEIRNSAWLFLEDMHATTRGDAGNLALLRLWGYYNEFAMWSLIAMALSGGYLWLSSRPRLRWAQACLVASSALSALIYMLVR